MNLKPFLAVAVLLLLAFTASAQSDKTGLTLTLGPALPLLDQGIGIHAGANPTFSLGDHWAIEGQLSYLHTRVSSSFISGGRSTDQAMQALAGIRFYLLSPAQSVRPYLSGLGGAGWFREMTDAQEVRTEWIPGISLGAYVAIQRWVVGLAFETPGNVVLKAGVRLGT